jgi:glycopeptide antibiotics resistance protein
VAFYLKKIGGTATFLAAIATEVVVFACWWSDIMAFLWLNVLGCLLVMIFAQITQMVYNRQSKAIAH